MTRSAFDVCAFIISPHCLQILLPLACESFDQSLRQAVNFKLSPLREYKTQNQVCDEYAHNCECVLLLQGAPESGFSPAPVLFVVCTRAGENKRVEKSYTQHTLNNILCSRWRETKDQVLCARWASISFSLSAFRHSSQPEERAETCCMNKCVLQIMQM